MQRLSCSTPVLQAVEVTESRAPCRLTTSSLELVAGTGPLCGNRTTLAYVVAYITRASERSYLRALRVVRMESETIRGTETTVRV